MHELGIAQSMLSAAFQAAEDHGSARITGLSIEMSALADESADSLRFHLESLAQGTIAEGARIDITSVPAQLQCLDCGKMASLDVTTGICPHCASANVRPVFQEEFRLVSIDVE